MIKNIIKNLKPSSTLLINEESKKLEKEGKKIFKFGFGQSPFQIPEYIVNELKKNSHQIQNVERMVCSRFLSCIFIRCVDRFFLFLLLFDSNRGTGTTSL